MTCKARGKFRKQGIIPLVGDEVEYTKTDEGTGTIEAVLERKNAFIRPPIANIEQMVIYIIR